MTFWERQTELYPASALHPVLGQPNANAVGAYIAEIEEHIRMLEAPILSGLWSDLKGEGLLWPDVPLPQEA